MLDGRRREHRRHVATLDLLAQLAGGAEQRLELDARTFPVGSDQHCECVA